MKRFFTYILALFLPVYLLVSLVWGNSVARNRPCKGLCVTVVDSAQAQYVSADEIRTYLEKYVPTDKKTILAEINQNFHIFFRYSQIFFGTNPR